MRILVIGDVHGRDNWKKAVEQVEYDKVVFLGDYFDSWNESAEQQIKNFNEILEFKKKSDNEVILLIGNHDYHYLIDTEKYSGYQESYAKRFKELILPRVLDGTLDVSHQYDKFLFTHAGVTNTWLESQGWSDAKKEGVSIDEFLAITFLNSFDTFRFNGVDNTGNDVTQGPFWVRPESLYSDAYGNGEITHVVGHTRIKNIQYIQPNILLCDTDNKYYAVFNTNTAELMILEHE